MAEIRDKKLDHEYDGIEEYDNPLPPWWVWLFVLTVIWGFGYMYYYHVGGLGGSSYDEYASEIKQHDEQVFKASMAAAAKNIKQLPVEPLTDAASVAEGQDIFLKNCVSCHGQKGEGGVGPNLTDNYWIHGGKFADKVNTITNGVTTKGMIAWKAVLRQDQIIKVASFITTLKGTNPPNAKAPQGDLFQEQ